ncbi:MAG: lysophospholipid acyltransferase family protein [Acidimicrobiia bacterium]
MPTPTDDAPIGPSVGPEEATPPARPATDLAEIVDITARDESAARRVALVPAPRPERLDLTDTERGIRRGDVDPYGRSESMRALARRIYDPMYRYWFRAEWEGLEHIPQDGGALLVANHAGAIPADAPVIMHGIEEELHRPVYGLAENLFRAIPFVGTMWSRLGGVAAHPDNAFRLLHDDRQLVLVFPEGTKGTGKTYRDRYKLHRFGRAGFVEIAMRSGVPVIPIAVVGNEEAMPILFKSRRAAALLNIPYFPVTANMLAFGPLGAGLYFPAKFRIRVLPPVHFDVAPDQERYPRAQVMDEADRIRDAIQDALYEMLRARRSVWRG